MLILTRKSGQSIRVADGIVFTILECSSGHVKVGITAPTQLPIHREEVYLRIREENLAAARGEAITDALKERFPEELRTLAEGEDPKESEGPSG